MSGREARVTEAHELSRLLVLVAEQAKNAFADTAGAVGLSPSLARAVVQLAEPLAMGDLADRLDCDRSYVTALADQLEARGLIERVPGADRRVKLLHLTAEGAAVRHRLSEALADDSVVLRRLDDAQRAALRPLLEALVDG